MASTELPYNHSAADGTGISVGEMDGTTDPQVTVGVRGIADDGTDRVVHVSLSVPADIARQLADAFAAAADGAEVRAADRRFDDAIHNGFAESAWG